MTNLDIQGEGVMTSVVFRQDGKHILGGSGLGTVRKWVTANGREVGKLMSVGVEVGAVATSRDGLWIVGGTTVGSVIVWDGTTQEKVVEIKSAHTDWVLSIDISPDCKTFVTGSYDETAVIWELKPTGQKLFELQHPSHVGGVRFSPNGNRLATATWGDLSIHVFDSHSGELLIRISNAVSSVFPNPLAWSDNGQCIFAPYEVSVNQFDVATAARVSSWKVDPHISVQLICLANSGQFIACSIDHTVTIWDTLTHVTICPPLRLTGRLKSIAISPDDTQVAFGQDDDKIVLLDLPGLLPHSYFLTRGTPTIVSENQSWIAGRQSRTVVAPLMRVNDLAFGPWMQGKLGNAESAFTQEITRHSNNDHHAFANRALIRVRSKCWRDAIDDAEKSIKIQLSAIALLAKCLALVGDGKINEGYRVCDLAIAQSTSDDAHFLGIVKSIIFCMTEDSEETISHIGKLVATMNDRAIFDFIQAQLCFWFGNLQLSRGEYAHAVQSFKRVQLPTQRLENPYLTTLSLLFGWNFEDLSIDAQRGLCEALCKADMPKEAIETLHEMMSIFDMETRPSQSTAEWVTNFTQRCVLALDRAGDTASKSYDHEKAAVHYALALSHCQTFSRPILKKWVDAKLTNNSWKDVLKTALEFKAVSRLEIYQAICEGLAECGGLSEATECFHAVLDDMKGDTAASDKYGPWILDFKHRCGDVAMQLRQYDAAIDHYSAAISLQPLNLEAFIKRSRAQAAKGLFHDALHDTDEAMNLDPSRPLVYETKHAVLHSAGRYDEAISVFESMLTMVEQSSDSAINQLRNNYVTPSETSAALDIIVDEVQRHCPLILIDVHTGELCDVLARTHIFKSDPVSKELVSSMTKKLDKKRIREVVLGFLKYVMLSHVWTRPEEGREPSLQEVNEVKFVWELPATKPNEKLRNFCKKTRSLGFRWAWSDTCCIDKLSNVVLDQSLTSMYKWYENSAATLVLLATVVHPSKRGDLPLSPWMFRAWTLQELLAPKVILFYDSTWKPYLGDGGNNHKESPEIMQELADAIKIPSRSIISFHPDSLTVREKLRLASKRNATREEDVAYCLIGIFKSDVRPHYGEGYAALGHLLDEIVTRSGEVTVLDWIGRSSAYNSCLPASLSVYREAPHSPSPIEAKEMEASIARLGIALTRARNEAMRFYTTIRTLPDAGFTNRRLSLPCVIFRANSLQVHDLRHSSEKEYGAEAPGLGHVNVVTADILSPREAQRLVFVHPWIRSIRGPHSVVTRGHETGFDIGFVPASSSYSGPFPQVDEYTRALELIARLEQPFNALLLLQQEDGKYKRVATEHAIIVKPDITSLADIRVETLQIL